MADDITNVDISTTNDADFVWPFTLTKSTGGAFDLTGCSLRMGVRSKASDANLPLLLTTENGGITITDAAAGKLTLTISQDQLLRLPAGTYQHSLIVITGSTKTALWRGKLTNIDGPSRGNDS